MSDRQSTGLQYATPAAPANNTMSAAASVIDQPNADVAACSSSLSAEGRGLRSPFVGRRAGVDGRLQQAPRLVAVAAVERGQAGLEQLLRLALPLGERAAGPLDVRAGAGVPSIEEERTRPDVHRLVVLSGEVLIEAEEQELFDLRVAIGFRFGIERSGTVGAKRIRHR